MKFQQAMDGEWIQPIKRGYKMAYCDCGLVHRMDFRLSGSKIQFRAWRDRRATNGRRRRKGLAVVGSVRDGSRSRTAVARELRMKGQKSGNGGRGLRLSASGRNFTTPSLRNERLPSNVVSATLSWK